ncbi:MAG: hypothetical protein CFH25_00554 [Alphaproteobacteria bacterium MarineAlpha6_Bin3]|nr:MAG: hypothetical protein CFH25_00554 [Alphaproteobacteria bacterium MarineAlpha6_Bin3]|tara:strand:- start:10760 stop:11926 length:1167 start_codon:yes stop_codon:yes gene_type:complete
MFYKILFLFVISIALTNCGLLDRGSKDDVAELEPIPDETVLQEPSILIDDDEMMAQSDELGATEYVEIGDRSNQMQSEPSGTFVGQKIGPLREDYVAVLDAFNVHRDDYEEVKSRVYSSSTEFYGTVAAINTKLQLGTTPGNPSLVRQYDQAQRELDNIEEYMREINLLNQKVNADAGVVALLKSTLNKTLRLAGAIDQDHRQLELLEDNTEKLEVDIARLINEITEEISRQAGFAKIENQNLLVMAVAIRNGEQMGTGILNRSFLAAQALAEAGSPDEQLAVPKVNISGLPLVVIRFDDPDIDYEKTLFDAIGTTVDKKSSATFGLVAVSPIGKNEGETRINASKVKKYAERVLRSMVSFGMPSKKIALSAKTSGDVVVPEVHIYVQ